MSENMRHLLMGTVFAAVWTGCVVAGLAIPWVADPKHDVEFALAGCIGMITGGLLGPLIGYLAVRLAIRTR